MESVTTGNSGVGEVVPSTVGQERDFPANPLSIPISPASLIDQVALADHTFECFGLIQILNQRTV